MHIQERTFQFTGALQNRNTTNRIILHHFAGSGFTVDQLHQMHLNQGWSGIGYHFYIRQDGSIHRGRPENTIGAHAKGANADSIGICHEGNYEVEETMPEAQKQASIWLLEQLHTKYGNISVVGHRDVMATACPGRNFPFEEIVNGQVSQQADPQSTPEPQPEPILVQQYDEWVARLQNELNVQFGAGLVVDGIAGPRTLVACILVRKGARGNITYLIQERYGFTESDLDGIYGDVTEAHTRMIQEQKGFIVDGIVGTQVWGYLLQI